MKQELEYSLRKLKDAFLKLEEGVLEADSELQKDGVIQRFEFTFELLWKAVRLFLKDKGIDTRTPKDSLKEAFRVGWIKDEETFARMLEDRNETSHVYSQEKSREIFDRIKEDYVGDIEKILIILENALGES